MLQNILCSLSAEVKHYELISPKKSKQIDIIWNSVQVVQLTCMTQGRRQFHCQRLHGRHSSACLFSHLSMGHLLPPGPHA